MLKRLILIAILLAAGLVIFLLKKSHDAQQAQERILDFARTNEAQSATLREILGDTTRGLCVLEVASEDAPCLRVPYDDDVNEFVMIDFGRRRIALPSAPSGRGVSAWATPGNDCVDADTPIRLNRIPALDGSMAGVELQLHEDGMTPDAYCREIGK